MYLPRRFLVNLDNGHIPTTSIHTIDTVNECSLGIQTQTHLSRYLFIVHQRAPVLIERRQDQINLIAPPSCALQSTIYYTTSIEFQMTPAAVQQFYNFLIDWMRRKRFLWIATYGV